MSVTVYKVWSAGELLSASDLNSSFQQIVTNGTSVAFPATANISVGGFTLWFDASNTMGATSSAKGVNLAGMAFNDAKTTVASATAPDIWTGTGNLIDYTGTTTATSFASAPQAGAQRQLLCAGAAVFTAAAGMLIDGVASGSNLTCAAGDVVDVIAVTTTQFRLKRRPYFSTPQVDLSTCEFRLTLTTATPVTTADVTAATTVYMTPYKGNRIALYDGANWNLRSTAEISIAVPSSIANTLHDVFCYDNAGTPTLELAAWQTANDTTRVTALTLQNGVLVKTGATTRRYLGTFRTTAVSGQTEDSYAKRHLWNYYHRVCRPMRVTEATNSWTYTTAAYRQANGAAANQLDFVVGWSEDEVSAHVEAFYSNSTAGVGAVVGIGLDSTTTLATGCLTGSSSNSEANAFARATASIETFPGVGRHYLAWLEYSAATGTSSWYGDNASPTISQAGIAGRIWA